MKVTLAYEHDGHKPDSTVTVDDAVGRRLLREGNARPADAASRKAAADVAPDDSAQTTEASRSTRRTADKQKG